MNLHHFRVRARFLDQRRQPRSGRSEAAKVETPAKTSTSLGYAPLIFVYGAGGERLIGVLPSGIVTCGEDVITHGCMSLQARLEETKFRLPYGVETDKHYANNLLV